CHKKDLFLADKNYCFRCKELLNPNAEITFLNRTMPNLLSNIMLWWKEEDFLKLSSLANFSFYLLILIVSSVYLLPTTLDIFQYFPDFIEPTTVFNSQTEDFYMWDMISCNNGLSFSQIINIFGLLIFSSIFGTIIGLINYFGFSYQFKRL